MLETRAKARVDLKTILEVELGDTVTDWKWRDSVEDILHGYPATISLTFSVNRNLILFMCFVPSAEPRLGGGAWEEDERILGPREGGSYLA